MGKGGKKKDWPKSWKQVAAVGGTMVLRGRSFDREYVVLSVRDAEEPGLVENLEAVIIERTTRQPPS